MFWFEYLPDAKIVYAQINQVRDKEQETLAAFSQRLCAFIAANPVEKLALDLRLNRGGNGELLRPLVTGIQLNAGTNPQSANAHGALADAYFFKGEKELALKHYEQSLALSPGNFDVRDKVKQLRRQ